MHSLTTLVPRWNRLSNSFYPAAATDRVSLDSTHLGLYPDSLLRCRRPAADSHDQSKTQSTTPAHPLACIKGVELQCLRICQLSLLCVLLRPAIPPTFLCPVYTAHFSRPERLYSFDIQCELQYQPYRLPSAGFSFRPE